MKKLSIIPFILMSLVAIPSWGETMDDLVYRDGTHYKKFSDVPFTGEVKGKYQGKIKNGKKEGPWVYYHDSGQLWVKGKFKNGKSEGSWVFYHQSGQLAEKGEYRSDKRDGSWVGYHDNGQLWSKGTFKNGKREGPWVYYDDDGTLRKYSSGIFKDDVKISD